jgi:quercetin dioxygenase-like cupin family protein
MTHIKIRRSALDQLISSLSGSVHFNRLCSQPNVTDFDLVVNSSDEVEIGKYNLYNSASWPFFSPFELAHNYILENIKFRDIDNYKFLNVHDIKRDLYHADNFPRRINISLRFYKENVTLRPHIHPNNPTIFAYMINGSGIFSLKDEKTTVTGSDTFCFDGGDLHGFKSITPCWLLLITFDGQKVKVTDAEAVVSQ